MNNDANVIDFVFQNLMDETGQFYGVYDISQGETVATERRVSGAVYFLNVAFKRGSYFGC